MQLKVISSEKFHKKALRLKDQSPDAPNHRQMGEDEEWPSMDSLNLEDVDPETWEGWEREDLQSGWSTGSGSGSAPLAAN